MDTTKGVASFAALLQQQPLAQKGPQDSMHVITQDYAIYAMGPLQVSSLL